MSKRKATIEDLAGMVNRGFDGVDKRVKDLRDEMNDRFDRIEKLYQQKKLRHPTGCLF